MASPVEMGTMVKASLLLAHPVTLTVSADTARRRVTRADLQPKKSPTALLAVLQQILLSLRPHNRVNHVQLMSC